MGEYTVWWIDDTTSRESEFADRIEEHESDLSVRFEEPETAAESLKENAEEYRDVDLVLIDWVLNERGGFLGKGLTMAGTVREHLSEVPIYGFTSGSVSELKAPRTRDQFEAVFKLSDLHSQEGAGKLKQDLEDYDQIENCRGEGFRALLEPLDPPEGRTEELESVIPREYSNGLCRDRQKNGGSKLEFGNWVRNRFLVTPGPLWDDTWMATMIGLQVDHLDDYAEALNSTDVGDLTYSGVFDHRVNRRWWSAEGIGALVALADQRGEHLGEFHYAARDLLGAEDAIANCEVCGDEYPNTVAAGLEGEDAIAPVHYHCSHIHHNREGAFEDYRVADKLTET